MDDTTLLDLLPDYALGVLSDAERLEIEALLERSEEARHLLANYEATLSGLIIMTTPPQKAPASLTDAFAERLKAEEQKPGMVSAPRSRRVVRWSSLGMMAAALVILTISLLSVTGVLNNISLVQPTVVATNVNDLSRVLADPAASRLPVVFTDHSNAAGVLIMNRAGTDAVLDVSRMVVPPGGNQYQVWLIDKDGPKSAGLFTIRSSDDHVRHLIRGASALSNYTMVAITVEPNGGSSAPTTPPIAAVVF